MYKYPLSLAQLKKVAKPCSWVDQRLVRKHYSDALSHPACALYLFCSPWPIPKTSATTPSPLRPGECTQDNQGSYDSVAAG